MQCTSAGESWCNAAKIEFRVDDTHQRRKDRSVSQTRCLRFSTLGMRFSARSSEGTVLILKVLTQFVKPVIDLRSADAGALRNTGAIQAIQAVVQKGD
jgi:hypothetical protein